MHVWISRPEFKPNFGKTKYWDERECAHLIIERKEYAKFFVVHAHIESKSGRIKNTAWLESGDVIIRVQNKAKYKNEPRLKVFSKKDFYKKMGRNILAIVHYKKKEVICNMKEFKRYGRWYEFELGDE